MTSIPVVKPGDDISWSGQITRTGVTDFTGYLLSSHIRQIDSNTGALSADSFSADVAWLDAVAGTFSYRVPRSVTAMWPSGVCFRLDIRVENLSGSSVRTESAEFATEAGVTS